MTAFSHLSRIAFQKPLAATGDHLEGFKWRIARLVKRGEIVKSGIDEGASGVRHASLPGDVRIGPVGVIPEVLLAFGVSPEQIFTQAGIRLSSFSNPETRIAFEALGRLLQASAAATKREDFGLLVGERFRMRDLGLLGELMRHSPTVGDALRALLMHLQVYDRGAVPMLLRQEPSNVLLGYSIYRPDIPGIAYAYDAAIAIANQIMRDLCGPGWKPLRVQFSHYRPMETGAFRQLFGSYVQFDTEVSGISFESFWLDKPIAGSDASRRSEVLAVIKDAHGIAGMRFSEQVLAALPQLVLGGASSAKNVALNFGIHERTLRKRLTLEGKKYQDLLNQTRFDLAGQLLNNTRLPLSEVAAALNFADLATFSRAFRGWAGMSPTKWRNER